MAVSRWTRASRTACSAAAAMRSATAVRRRPAAKPVTAMRTSRPRSVRFSGGRYAPGGRHCTASRQRPPPFGKKPRRSSCARRRQGAADTLGVLTAQSERIRAGAHACGCATAGMQQPPLMRAMHWRLPVQEPGSTKQMQNMQSTGSGTNASVLTSRGLSPPLAYFWSQGWMLQARVLWELSRSTAGHRHGVGPFASWARHTGSAASARAATRRRPGAAAASAAGWPPCSPPAAPSPCPCRRAGPAATGRRSGRTLRVRPRRPARAAAAARPAAGTAAPPAATRTPFSQGRGCGAATGRCRP